MTAHENEETVVQVACISTTEHPHYVGDKDYLSMLLDLTPGDLLKTEVMIFSLKTSKISQQRPLTEGNSRDQDEQQEMCSLWHHPRK
ncbi:hypothetical protein O3P69_008122 [Scylla paramamosain]|uniref:Uncharacterized protein n=1 Tax=Scylla paramamosain TaxID=85552 RepID=A0AAW0T0A4_SCYPA